MNAPLENLLAGSAPPTESRRVIRSADPARALGAPQTTPFDWDALLALAARHRVRPLLCTSLTTAASGSVPPHIIADLKEFTAANARRNLFLTGALFRVLDLLQSHGISAAPFKGPTLGSLAYGNIAMREAGDLDLLVRRRDIVRAKHLLIAQGFQPAFPTASQREAGYLQSLTGKAEIRYLTTHCEHHMVRPAGGVNVDLHWALALREFWLRISEREVWNWVPTPQTFSGRSVLGFAAEEMLLVLCINGAKDCWERLDRICDVAELLRTHPDLNWRRVFDRAARFGGTRMVCLGLRLAADLLNAALPPPAVERIMADPVVSKLCVRVRRRLLTKQIGEVESAGVGKSLLHLATRERLHDRIGYCLAHLEPTVGDWAAFPLPDALRFLHLLTRPLRLARNFCTRM